MRKGESVGGGVGSMAWTLVSASSVAAAGWQVSVSNALRPINSSDTDNAETLVGFSPHGENKEGRTRELRKSKITLFVHLFIPSAYRHMQGLGVCHTSTPCEASEHLTVSPPGSPLEKYCYHPHCADKRARHGEMGNKYIFEE